MILLFQIKEGRIWKTVRRHRHQSDEKTASWIFRMMQRYIHVDKNHIRILHV